MISNLSRTKEEKLCGPIISWQIDGVTVETLADFICLGSKITADGDCSHEIKRRLLLGPFAFQCQVLWSLNSVLPFSLDVGEEGEAGVGMTGGR